MINNVMCETVVGILGWSTYHCVKCKSINNNVDQNTAVPCAGVEYSRTHSDMLHHLFTIIT